MANTIIVTAVFYNSELKTCEIKELPFELKDREWVWHKHYVVPKYRRVTAGVDNHGCIYVLLRAAANEVHMGGWSFLPDILCNFQAQVEENAHYTQPLTPNAIAHMKRFLDASFASIDNDVLQRFRDMARIDTLEERLHVLEAKFYTFSKGL